MSKIKVLLHKAIENRIYVIRNQKVMLDSDLAELYGVETKHLKRQVNRNIGRFPIDFMFELSSKEAEILRCQIGASSWGGARYLPKVFTEHGVLMLSSVLNSKRAVQVNIEIMRVFAKIRQYISDNTELRLEIELIKKKVNNHDKNIELLFSYLDELLDKKKTNQTKQQIGFKR